MTVESMLTYLYRHGVCLTHDGEIHCGMLVYAQRELCQIRSTVFLHSPLSTPLHFYSSLPPPCCVLAFTHQGEHLTFVFGGLVYFT